MDILLTSLMNIKLRYLESSAYIFVYKLFWMQLNVEFENWVKLYDHVTFLILCTTHKNESFLNGVKSPKLGFNTLRPEKNLKDFFKCPFLQQIIHVWIPLGPKLISGG